MFFLEICVELARNDWKQTTLKSGFYITTNTYGISACWILTHPAPCSLRESLSSEGLGQGARLQSLMVYWGQQVASFLLSPRNAKWQWEMGTGAVSHRVTSPVTAQTPLGRRRRKRKERR